MYNDVASNIGTDNGSNVQIELNKRLTSDDLAAASGASLIGASGGGTIQTALAARALTSDVRFFRSTSHEMRIGYDFAAEQAAGIKIGANDAFRGRGALVVGGAGPRDRGNGTYLVNDGHPNWLVPMSSMKFGPTEFNIYGNATGGIATKSATKTLTKLEGADWDGRMVGRTLWFRGAPFTVATVLNAITLTLTADPASGTGAWNFPLTTGGGTCTVSGTTITRVGGEPFIPVFGGTGFTFRLNGSPVTVTSIDSDTYQAVSAPGDGTYNYDYFLDINSQISTFRLQKVAGRSEENLSLFARPDGYWVVAAASNEGELYPVWFCSNYERVMEIHATGKFVSMGGVAGHEAARFVFGANAVNYIEHYGSPAGSYTSLRARGADANVGINFDAKGVGDFMFTSGNFERVNFKIRGSNGVDNLCVDAATGAPYLAAEGASANIDIAFTPKGDGLIRFGDWSSRTDTAINGYINVKDSAGNTRKLATIA